MRTGTKRSGFTLTELLVVMAIAGIIAAIVLPALLAARARGQTSECVSNMRQISYGLLMYAQEHDGTLPPVGDDSSGNWDKKIFPDVRSAEVFHCPACPVPSFVDRETNADGTPTFYAKGYALNAVLYSTDILHPSTAAKSEVPFPASTVLLCETSFRVGSGNTAYTSLDLLKPDTGHGLRPGWSTDGPPGGVRHQGGSNYDFADGHTQWYTPEQVRDADTGPNDGQNPSFAL